MILCCGEALIDMISNPLPSGELAYVPHVGGAVFNTSIALGRLGGDTALLTGISTDLFGDQLRDALRASDVKTDLLIPSERPSTLAFAQLTSGHASYTFFDENSALRSVVATDLPEIPAAVTALYFGGISLASEPVGDTFADLMVREGQNRAVMIDPNIRPSFIRDEARYRKRLARCFAVADIVKLSDEDLAWLVPSSNDIGAQARTVLSQGPSMVIVTRGAEGATAFLTSGDETTVPSRKVDVVDTVGAGDTFNAGVLTWLSENGCLDKERLKALSPEDAAQALDFGGAVAAITVSRAGANPPWRAEVF